jgi:hypothetical protein
MNMKDDLPLGLQELIDKDPTKGTRAKRAGLSGLKMLLHAPADALFWVLKWLRRNLAKIAAVCFVLMLFIWAYMDGVDAARLEMRNLGYGLGEPSLWQMGIWLALLTMAIFMYIAENAQWTAYKVLGNHPVINSHIAGAPYSFMPPAEVVMALDEKRKRLEALNRIEKDAGERGRRLRAIEELRARAGSHVVIADGGWRFPIRKRNAGKSRLALCVPKAYLLNHGTRTIRNLAYTEKFSLFGLVEKIGAMAKVRAVPDWVLDGVRAGIPEFSVATWALYYGNRPTRKAGLAVYMDNKGEHGYIWTLVCNTDPLAYRQSLEGAKATLQQLQEESTRKENDLNYWVEYRKREKEGKEPTPAPVAPAPQPQPQNNNQGATQ